MTRILSCFLIVLFFAGAATAQIDPASKFYLLGKVKTITESSYVGLASGKEYIKGPKGWPYSWLTDSRTELDSNGNIVKIVYLDNLAKPIRTDEFKFENGKLTSSQTAEKDQAFEYDSLGRISREIIIRRKMSDKPNDPKPSVESTRIIYTYDAKNRLKQKLQYDLSDKLTSTKTFEYDSLNNLVLEKAIQGNEKDSIVYSYNRKNQLILLEWFDEADKLKDRTFFEYGTDGFVVHQKWEDFDDGIPDGTVVYKYENGHEKEILDIEADGTFGGKETYSFTFDKTGNWIRKVTIIDNEEIFIIERKIEYYIKK